MCCVACERNTWCGILIGLYQVQRFVGAYVRRLLQLTNRFSVSKQHRKLTICRVQFGNGYWTKYIRAVSSNSYRQHLLSVAGYCNSVYGNDILHTISAYWQHKSLFNMNGNVTEWDNSLCWHVHWRVIIFLKKRSLMIAENGTKHIVNLNQIT